MNKPRLDQHRKEGLLALSIAVLLGMSASVINVNGSNNHNLHQAVLGATANPNVTLKVLSVRSYDVNTVTQLKRVSVSLSVANNSGKVLQISPGLQMQLIDSAGVSHAVTAVYLPAGTIIGGPQKNTSTWKQTIDFDVSAHVSPKTFVYQPDGATSALQVGL